MDKLVPYMIAVIAVLALVTIFVFISGENEKGGLTAKYQSQIDQCLGNLVTCEGSLVEARANERNLSTSFNELNRNNSNLQGAYNKLGETYSELEAEYASVDKRINKTLSDIESYKTEILESMSWFQTNSELGNSTKEETAKKRMKSSCVEVSKEVCTLNAGCLWLINEKTLSLRYKYDKGPNGTLGDRLISLSDFIKNWGGDCEDYALFYKAEWNYAIKQICNGSQRIDIKTYDYGDGTGGRYWLDLEEKWYVRGDTVMLEEYIYPNIVCGNMYDPQSDSVNGHCVIALTKRKLTNISEISTLLTNAPLIEPQSGEYLGRIGATPKGVPLYKAGQEVDNTTLGVYAVITDEDLMMYSITNRSWQSYSSFFDELNRQITQLSELE